MNGMKSLSKEEVELLYLAGGDKQNSRDDCIEDKLKYSTSTSSSSTESFFGGQNTLTNCLQSPANKHFIENRINVQRLPPQNGGDDPSNFHGCQNERSSLVKEEEEDDYDADDLMTGRRFGNDDLDLASAFDSMISVHELYQNKMDWIQQNVPRGSVQCPNLKSKINLYQLWVDDLREQNQALIEIIQDLDHENSKEVDLLKIQLKKIQKRFLEQDSLITELEKDLDRLNLTNKKLQQENNSSQGKIKLYEEEVDNLTSLLLRIRDETRIGSNCVVGDDVASQSSFTFHEKCIELESAQEGLGMLKKKFDEEEEESLVTSKIIEHLQTIQDLRTNLRDANIQLKYYNNIIEDFKGKIRVYCRIRPLSPDEDDESIVTKYLDPYTVGVETSKGLKEFQFDRIFGPQDDQKTVFEQTKSLIQSAFDGYNVCIAAYGQTGSGKTFTILGHDDSDLGIASMAISELFSITKKMESSHKTVISYYAVELYQQKLIDLLSIDAMESSSSSSTTLNHNETDLGDTNNNYYGNNCANSEKLEIRRDHTGTVFIQGARTIVVDNCETFEKSLRQLLIHRHTAETQINQRSSRSHFIMGIIIENTSKINKSFLTRSKLSLVDLAGSERNKKCNGAPSVLEESKMINKSLSALEHVIVALTTEQPHVPYRNNKLTELMQDSIGGNAKTLIFVNISPTLTNVDETIVSLNYGARVKQVVNGAVRNVESKNNTCGDTPRSKQQQRGQPTKTPNSSKPCDHYTPRSSKTAGFTSRH